MSAQRLDKETFNWPVRVYWEDTDAGGIVFYANYLKFFERARTEWLRAKGISQQALKEATGGMFVVGEVQVRFLKSARLDDELLLTTSLQEAGRASMTIHQQALLSTATGPVLLCEATVRAGWVQASTLKPDRIPTQILHALT
ncbi:tol-pal system-associated acyl-CoA thioesterase [Rhodoferax sp.]|uniref:tol-pal system-associated acyl-CoA thioesterase n=1 Tax=Rhodoferax sp. TaxID=50421 RepID=UPI00271BF7C4|nr:tol-pal system-associated acyl-CoA thioesterase [Rhodoferax sp.]MDO9145435.1 tol-pal system-associated acyl-CoA thioesterase [Rhodoferax sp.]MDP3193246.1 tol-pal system-associated acyl-CoA thioesterase [Rhodoferax sp.]MDP3336569.1 tol-pal system-associated acyl-CoA thioesterase [Rhodoferax sp.]MDP3865295.1 tol-pal system-associated acyl-CoA thioesterase [Rhodoferax sp.]